MKQLHPFSGELSPPLPRGANLLETIDLAIPQTPIHQQRVKIRGVNLAELHIVRSNVVDDENPIPIEERQAFVKFAARAARGEY